MKLLPPRDICDCPQCVDRRSAVEPSYRVDGTMALPLPLLILIGVAVVIAALLTVAPGCTPRTAAPPGSGLLDAGRGLGGLPGVPEGSTEGASSSWAVLQWMAMLTFIPAVGAIVASVWLPFLRGTAGALLAVSIGTAIAPWALERYGDAAILPAAIVTGIGLAIAVGALLWQWWGRRQLAEDARRRLAKVSRDAQAEPDPAKRLRDEGATIALRRLLDPRVDRQFSARRLAAVAAQGGDHTSAPAQPEE